MRTSSPSNIVENAAAARPAPVDAALRAAFAAADDWFAAGLTLFEATADEQHSQAVTRLLYHNFQVWHYEDLGRTDDDAKILVGWRGAMRHNRHRNEQINRIDAALAPFFAASAPLHSESLGALVDRVTILYLKYKNYLSRCHKTADMVHAQLEELVAYAASLQRRIVAGTTRCQQVPRIKLYLPASGPTT